MVKTGFLRKNLAQAVAIVIIAEKGDNNMLSNGDLVYHYPYMKPHPNNLIRHLKEASMKEIMSITPLRPDKIPWNDWRKLSSKRKARIKGPLGSMCKLKKSKRAFNKICSLLCDYDECYKSVYTDKSLMRRLFLTDYFKETHHFFLDSLEGFTHENDVKTTTKKNKLPFLKKNQQIVKRNIALIEQIYLDSPTFFKLVVNNKLDNNYKDLLFEKLRINQEQGWSFILTSCMMMDFLEIKRPSEEKFNRLLKNCRMFINPTI